jgi:hypothetical protein
MSTQPNVLDVNDFDWFFVRFCEAAKPKFYSMETEKTEEGIFLQAHRMIKQPLIEDVTVTLNLILSVDKQYLLVENFSITTIEDIPLLIGWRFLEIYNKYFANKNNLENVNFIKYIWTIKCGRDLLSLMDSYDMMASRLGFPKIFS